MGRPALAERFAGDSAELVDLEVRSQLAGRWRMATMRSSSPPCRRVIYLAAGLPATVGRR